MLGLPFASVGAASATAASPDAAIGGAVVNPAVDPAAILESALGTAAGLGVAGLAEANVAGAGGVAGSTALVEAVAGALVDCVSAGGGDAGEDSCGGHRDAGGLSRRFWFFLRRRARNDRSGCRHWNSDGGRYRGSACGRGCGGHRGRAHAGHNGARGKRRFLRFGGTVDEREDDSCSRGRSYRGRHENQARRAREAWRRGQVAPFRTEIPGGTHQIPCLTLAPATLAVTMLALSNRAVADLLDRFQRLIL